MTGPAYAVATSEHPIAVHAVGECAGSLLEISPGGFEAVLCFAARPFGGALSDIAAALRELLGASGVGAVECPEVLMGARMSSGTPALAVIAFATGRASIGYNNVAEPGFLGIGSGPVAVEPSRRANLRIVFADPPARRCGTSSPAGLLPRQVSLVGGQLAGDPDRDRMRIVHNGVEHRDGALSLDMAADNATVHIVHGTQAAPESVVVTSVADGQIVALDDMPAAELLESRVRSMGIDIRDGVKQVGFSVPGDGRLVAARRSPLGLSTSLPLAPGATLYPAVHSERAVAEELGAVLKSHSDATVLLLPTGDLMGALALDERCRSQLQGVPQVVGPLVSGVLWGDSVHCETLTRSVVLVAMCEGPAPSVPLGGRHGGL